jgi:hypothetical protein
VVVVQRFSGRFRAILFDPQINLRFPNGLPGPRISKGCCRTGSN